ncbi:exo-beta-N-acetylmuramidase NamZ family protein [Aquimarina agarivorans]|uniref:exo-beta-N-acetylmuramidase NamZ family protein n=1 Tax=Aquimarina agarivorans TaxID=980584 RepID=UPI000248FD6C|nr:DUF1343 domain-containing protein [Aquimarina agarivorans]
MYKNLFNLRKICFSWLLTFFKNTFLILVFPLFSCGIPNTTKNTVLKTNDSLVTPVSKSFKKPILTGAAQIDTYIKLLTKKNIAIVGNPTSIVFSKNKQTVHLVDTLLKHQIHIKKVFAPEHGFRGTADAGEVVKNGKDVATGLPIVSLYGKNKKPSQKMLSGIDLVVFDVQDVGARFYTYISTLHYIMEACAEAKIPVIVLDRPNPNGHYIDGPIRKAAYKSFVGLHPIPIVHGMTIGEYAQMINGEGWLQNSSLCELTVIPLKNYTHNTAYSLPVKPSPNLPNDQSINLYPSLCLFEGTRISVGRGTDLQFQIYGAPQLPKTDFSFTPVPKAGAKHPKFEYELCFGENLKNHKKLSQLNLKWLLKAYKESLNKDDFFTSFFEKLAGTDQLRKQITSGVSEKEIRASWQKDLDHFKLIRKKYLLYP